MRARLWLSGRGRRQRGYLPLVLRRLAHRRRSSMPLRNAKCKHLVRQTRRRLRRRRVRSRQQVLPPSPPVLRRLAPSLPVFRRLQCLDAWHQVVQRWDIWCFCHVQSCAQCHAQVQVSPEFAKMHPSLADAMHTAASDLQEVRCGDLSLAGSASGSEALSADASTPGFKSSSVSTPTVTRCLAPSHPALGHLVLLPCAKLCPVSCSGTG